MIGQSVMLYDDVNPIYGLGLYNLFPICKESLIYPYTGELIDEEEQWIRECLSYKSYGLFVFKLNFEYR